MSNNPDHFWEAFSAISQALAAAATFAAVVVSLWISLSERRPKLRVYARLMTAMGGALRDELDVIDISVTNIGQRPVRVVTVGWRVGWFNRAPRWRQMPVEVKTAF